MCRLLPLLSIFFLIAGSSHAQETWSEQLRMAATAGDSEQVAILIKSNRLDVKPLVEEWISSALSANNSKDEEAGLSAASTLARVFSRVFEEDNLQLRVQTARNLSPDEVQLKLRADSLYSGAVSRRSVAEGRSSVLDDLLKAEALYRSIEDASGLAETLGQLGYVSWFLDRDVYLSYNESALTLRREIGDMQLMGNTLNDLGLYHRVIARDYASALEVYLESESIRWAIGDSVRLSRTIPNIALSYEGLGDFENALIYYEKGADLYWAVGDTARYIGQRNNAAGVLTDYLERHSDALYEMLQLKEEMRAIDDARTEALVSNSIGVVSRRLGDYQNAIMSYQDVIALSEQHGFDDLLAAALNNIGVVYLWIERAERAIPYFEKAKQQFDALESYEGSLDALLNQGMANYEIKNYTASINILDEAKQIATKADDRLKLGTIEAGLGNSVLRAEGPNAAVAHYHAALDIARDYDVPDLIMVALFGLGESAEEAGRADEALAWYRDGIQSLESVRGLQHAEEDKAGYMAQARMLFEDVVDFMTKEAIETGEIEWLESAFNFSEQAKARAFVDQLAEAIAGVQLGVDEDLLLDQQVLTENLIYLRDELSVETDRGRRDELRAMVREQEQEFDRVERDLRSKNESYSNLRYPNPITLSVLQSDLRPGYLVLSYSVGDSSSTLWAINRSSAMIYELPTRDALSSQIDVLRFALGDPSRGSAESYAATASDLYATLVAPAGEMVKAAERIIVIPDDVLNYVPFEALVSASGTSFSEHTYFLSEAEISYVQSATVLAQLSERESVTPSREFLAIGNPEFGGTNGLSNLRGASLAALPFAGEEVERIASLFEDSSKDVFTGNAATESAIQNAVRTNTYRYVHFATHGLINDDRPDYSALALAQGSTKGEGLLQASEIFNLPFNAELVVLSACETGLGQLIQGEGMVGLTRAFMYAGASSLVVSLWSVADASTAELMQQFYGNLIERNQPKSEALRNAKLTLLVENNTSHPFYWAPFVLIGEAE